MPRASWPMLVAVGMTCLPGLRHDARAADPIADPVADHAVDHRGGTLRLTAHVSAGTLDPQIDYTTMYMQLFSVVYDGLLNFRKAEGAAGNELVPDLAESLPQTPDGGRTWIFTLRRGVRFSNGAEVGLDDVVASLRRIFIVGSPTAGSFYGGILGADECLRDAAHCTLSDGVQVDPATRRITIRLKEPDAEFPQKIAFPHASILPADTPAHDVGNTPIAATGPYRIVSYDPQRHMRLERNPYFHVWNAEAQPDGYVDAISYDFGLSDEDAVTAVENGQYDWAFGNKPLDRLGELGARYTAQVHVQPLYGLYFLPMNVNIAPFSNLQARQAVNYALDRRAMTILAGGSALASPLCTMVPPGLLPDDGRCAYTRDATPDHPAPAWRGADLDRARQLVRDSGTAGQDVTLVVAANAVDISMGTYVRGILQSIGYQAHLRTVSQTIHPGYIENTDNHVQISMREWYADYPSPSNFLDTLFGCENFHPHSDSSINISGFCDASIQQVMDRARQDVDPQSARMLWARASDMITRQSPAVPMIHMSYVDVVSKRLGHYFYTSLYHMIFSQVWVR
ncbi:ABC transporter substrate-binding protein [Novacetimonas pomaceti]|uniref:ABC transporter substrate-binding protein n=1 Tax=Novacetimonas pomaceti TaxID=2021998 RepID=UPI0038D0CA94